MGLDMYLHRKENVYGEPAIEIKKANECIQETIEQLEGVIKDAEESDKDVWFEYYASW